MTEKSVASPLTASWFPSEACTSLYGHPQAGEALSAYSPYDITWDCSCLSEASTLDIILYSYGGGRLYEWRGVKCPDNKLSTQFNPTWWNSTSQATLQLQISDSSQPAWASSTGLGPSFIVNWNGTTPSNVKTSTNGTSNGVTVESVNAPQQTGGLSGGKLAAAVTVPLLIAAVGVAAYIFYSRRKRKGERKRWSAYVDHRLSQISTQPGGWDPAAAGLDFGDGARPSMSMSMYASRPSIGARSNHSLAGDGNLAGYGSKSQLENSAAPGAINSRPASSFYAIDGHSVNEGAPRQMGHSHAASRASRVSFAESALTNSNRRPNSYFANGTGTVSSPNHHRYKSSLANSSVKRPSPGRAHSYDGDDKSRPESTVDVPSFYGISRPTSLGYSQSMDNLVESLHTAPPVPAFQPNGTQPKKGHAITVSTSMPFLQRPAGRETIMSPDEMLRAYAKKAPASTDPGDIAGDEEPRGSPDEKDGKRSKFAGKFGFGFAK